MRVWGDKARQMHMFAESVCAGGHTWDIYAQFEKIHSLPVLFKPRGRPASVGQVQSIENVVSIACNTTVTAVKL